MFSSVSRCGGGSHDCGFSATNKGTKEKVLYYQINIRQRCALCENLLPISINSRQKQDIPNLCCLWES